jgi:hypothetical protein
MQARAREAAAAALDHGDDDGQGYLAFEVGEEQLGDVGV